MIVTILIAVVCGFVAGVLGSIVTRDMTEHRLEQKTIEDAQQYAALNKRIEHISSQYKACTVALEQLTYKFVRERGAVWESLNGLWNDYDDRQKQAQSQKPSEGTKKAATGSKQKKTKGDSDNG